MKLILVLGLFLISALPASAQFKGTYDEYVKLCWPDGIDKPIKLICEIMRSSPPAETNATKPFNPKKPCIPEASTKKTGSGATADTTIDFKCLNSTNSISRCAASACQMEDGKCASKAILDFNDTSMQPTANYAPNQKEIMPSNTRSAPAAILQRIFPSLFSVIAQTGRTPKNIRIERAYCLQRGGEWNDARRSCSDSNPAYIN